ncbi:gluconate 2-dehydrogenase subunit 3 family protein [Methylocystis sp. MJC1]|jgi:hypothetical protein|uniref:gluconate 2-dehydrogenase subunit 3 family protein n=1 Tax=Methylocystis sp. MJC1 TaxID=2654282 RepID=UPI0013EC51BE|nr:gluconate 2-dehydrogenase subunit 3 family protein [Methylocystis sp. MJC1]KAF2989883.1 hypothetical protein MJC1_03021 [Methylocystis sp. MJC1]MBU6528348.1 gluconate 2-dehydrogenase subunit 3 family protein [Methylocystis sp. MJC1]UZX11253.1 gluconate 2-dehydrogenase subunit 3 family protein [Methylocystis sp. MJC1]
MTSLAKPPEVSTPYEGYDVLAKWNTPSYDDRTREVVIERLRDIPARRFFTVEELALLEAIVERLAPAFPLAQRPPIALWIDDRLYKNLGEGFRNEGVPPLQTSWRMGLAGIDGEAGRLFSAAFSALEPSSRDAVLRAVQNGEVEASLWRDLDPKSFFSDMLLKTIAGLAYSHPAAWSDIGFGGPASPRGYVRLGFDSRDSWEAKEYR